MNVGLVCFAAAGGSGTVAAGLGRELARLGHLVHVIAPAPPFRLGELSDRMRFHRVRPDGDDATAGLAARLAAVALAERLDVLHAHYASPHAIAACRARSLLAGRHRLAVVTTLHGTDVTAAAGDAARRDETRGALDESDGVTAVSHALAAAASEVFALDDAVRVISNFVDVDEFRPLQSRASDAARERVVVHVSTFRPVKRAADCVAVLARLRERLPCRLVMVGDGPETGAARALAERLGVARHVEFVGAQTRVADLLARADLLLLPSASESFGLAALEAMSCAVPVVASRVGGLPEVVADGVCGRLVPPGDVDGMASAALEILGDERRAAAMGEAGRRMAVERFDVRRMVPRYVEFYREICAERTVRCGP